MAPPFVLFVSGSRNSGKTKTCIKLFKRLLKLGFSVGGIITIKSDGSETLREKRFVVDLSTNKRTLFAVRKADGRYRFVPAGIRFANKIIREFFGDVLIVDEVGKLEMKGRGFQEVFKKLKSSQPKAVVISCRDINVEWLAKKILQKTAEVKAEDAGSIEQALKLILGAIE